MATQPPANLPLFYKNLIPLQSTVHGNHRVRVSDKAPFFAKTHAVPLTIEEFVDAQRFFPIVFSTGDNPVPLALFGLNEGVNLFLEDDGTLKREIYVPAYVRRYPFMLARLAPEAEELSLCFDPESGMIGEFDDGDRLFDDGKPSEATRNILDFCERFETAAQRTNAFVTELQSKDLLMDGEVAIQLNGQEQPYIYRGFGMVNEDKLRALPADDLKTFTENGIMTLVMAHLASLQLVRQIFARQVNEGKVPTLNPAITPA